MLKNLRNKKVEMLKAMLKNKKSHIDLLLSYIHLLEQRNKDLEKTINDIEVRHV